MILTVTPNATVDKTYRVEGFRLDRVNRPSRTYTVAGGKGLNVARVYQTLGGTAISTGFLGGLNGRIVARAMRQEGLADAFVRVQGETRLCIAVIDPEAGTQTEVNEQGPEIPARSVRELLREVTRLLSQQAFEFVVLSGSLPPGVPDTLYANLIGIARKAGVDAVLDSSGAALRAGLEEKPFLIKPNRTELESLFTRPLRDRAEILDAAQTLQKRGGAFVAASLGAEGALLVGQGAVWNAVPPQIAFASAVASGDSFVAAFLWAWKHGEKPGDAASALRLATGAGAANAAVIGAGFCTRDSILNLAKEARIERQA